jgi:hypothetical protein
LNCNQLEPYIIYQLELQPNVMEHTASDLTTDDISYIVLELQPTGIEHTVTNHSTDNRSYNIVDLQPAGTSGTGGD